jgi:hypothetical protein
MKGTNVTVVGWSFHATMNWSVIRSHFVNLDLPAPFLVAARSLTIDAVYPTMYGRLTNVRAALCAINVVFPHTQPANLSFTEPNTIPSQPNKRSSSVHILDVNLC